jgi:hypothetical protein
VSKVLAVSLTAAFFAVGGCGDGWNVLVEGAGVNREAAGCLGVLELNRELVEVGAGLGVADTSVSSSTADLGAKSELVVGGFGVAALKREDVEND